MNTFNVILNGKNVVGNEGESVYELATRMGFHIPTLCHDPRLEPFSSCFVCVVEIKGMRGMQPSCSTKITEGMEINTETAEIATARKMALDLLVSNHYADCLGPCKQTCPAGVDVQGYISLIEKGLYSEAIGLIKENNPLPAICGRVCVRPCEAACRRNLLEEGTGVGIDYLKRFAADKDLESKNHYKPIVAPPTGKKVAVIGGGPGGLSAAYWLAQKGHKVDIYEGMPYAGGWLRYGIPQYRLPNDLIDKEIATITELGVSIHTNTKLGEQISYKDIKLNYDATILTIGSQKGTGVGCEGEDADGVFSGIDFLRNMEATGQKYDFRGKKVAVVGGGNTAMDCCRTSIRCGADEVYVIYRRTEAEMPANPIEIHESKLEGVKYLFLHNPVMINKHPDGKLKSITNIQMALGEPDASGRRRPIPVEGSETTIEVDFLLAAIGQKTDVNFINDINEFAGAELKLTKWGDIEADKHTLQTSILGIFAAGDGVTGPATAIAAIAQAKVAVHSCHQYLMGEAITPIPAEFFSTKEIFREQKVEEYANRFKKQMREEMPVLDPSDRMNFNEVELGYSSCDIANKETGRCLECGCNALYTCDLKKYATEYGAVQDKFAGIFKEHNIDFSHPYIEIDQNKCVLCGRCIRICSEVVGAKALGFVNRGFETYVAPALGLSLKETDCESCGMCISTCPTGALSENKAFKPGPILADTFKTICPYCSVGCELEVHHKGEFVIGVNGAKGLVNADGNICRLGRFGYSWMNDPSRITKPMLKENNQWREITFGEALRIIKEKVDAVKPEENAFSAGARLSNEEMYLIQKIARAGVKTNNVFSFHYMERGKGYSIDSNQNVPFDQIKGASRIYLIGSETNLENPVAGFFIHNAQKRHNVPVVLITTADKTSVDHKADEIIRIKSYYSFIKAINHYILSKGLQNQMFIDAAVQQFNDYKSALLSEPFDKLVEGSGLSAAAIAAIAEQYNLEMNAILVFSEKHLSSNTALEVINLASICGKLGKTSNGIISLKEKNNSHGLRDMGLCPKTFVGGRAWDETTASSIENRWGAKGMPFNGNFSIADNLRSHKLKNLFIFGEDPVGCALSEKDAKELISGANFIVVSDYFMTETAKSADLILPAAFPHETGGSYTNTQHFIQAFDASMKSKIGMNNIEMLDQFAGLFGLKPFNDHQAVFAEIIELLKDATSRPIECHITENDNPKRLFNFGCDALIKRFVLEFLQKMN